MKFTWWKSGSWNTLCDRCGFKFKAEDLREEWDKLMVCKDCWELRHPQELIRPIQDQNKLPWTRPEGSHVFLTLSNGCTAIGMQGVAGVGVAGCMIVGRDLGIRNALVDVEGFH